MPIAEMQARVFLAVLTRNAELSSNSEMEIDVQNKLTAMRKQFYGSPRHTIQVPDSFSHNENGFSALIWT